jgi:hypothetical protein
MAALTADRSTPKRAGEQYSFPVAAATKIYAGSLVVLDASGNAEPGTTATGKVAVGRAAEYVDNSAGAAAAVNVTVDAGIFRYANGDTITKTSIGDTAYIVDDQTVSKASSGKSAAGIIIDLDSDGVWVDIRPETSLGSTGLVAANNLSDVGTVATARANLGLDTGDSPTFAAATITGTLSSGALEGGNAGSLLKTDKVSVSLAEMTDLVANPKELVAAGGANTVHELVGVTFKLNYGSAAFTESADNLQIKYVDGAGIAATDEIETTGSWLVQTADAYGTASPTADILTATAAQVANTALVLCNTSGDFGGGTGSTVDVWITYRTHDVS